MESPWAKHQVLLRELLRETRTAQNLTQAELAQRLGKPQSYISKTESGERRLDFVETREFCLACGESFPDFVARFERKTLIGLTQNLDVAPSPLAGRA